MVKVGLLVRLHARPGMEASLAQFLGDALALANREARTTAWFAIKFDASTFGIFDAFADEEGRRAHLDGAIASALGEKGAALLAKPPTIERVDVLAAKLDRGP